MNAHRAGRVPSRSASRMQPARCGPSPTRTSSGGDRRPASRDHPGQARSRMSKPFCATKRPTATHAPARGPPGGPDRDGTRSGRPAAAAAAAGPGRPRTSAGAIRPAVKSEMVVEVVAVVADPPQQAPGSPAAVAHQTSCPWVSATTRRAPARAQGGREQAQRRRGAEQHAAGAGPAQQPAAARGRRRGGQQQRPRRGPPGSRARGRRRPSRAPGGVARPRRRPAAAQAAATNDSMPPIRGGKSLVTTRVVALVPGSVAGSITCSSRAGRPASPAAGRFRWCRGSATPPSARCRS